jgi:hypothetical protein
MPNRTLYQIYELIFKSPFLQKSNQVIGLERKSELFHFRLKLIFVWNGSNTSMTLKSLENIIKIGLHF